MYVYVCYVHSISCMCVWLADYWLWYVFMFMISWMIRTPCEITDQLAVGTQNCFSTLFYMLYTHIKTSAQNAPKCTIARQKKSKKFMGRGTAYWGGDTPPQTPPPSAPSAPRFSRLRRSAFPFLFIYDSNTGWYHLTGLQHNGRRAFSVAGPMFWNPLPRHLRDPSHTDAVFDD